jgi:GntR family transcriptional regulator
MTETWTAEPEVASLETSAAPTPHKHVQVREYVRELIEKLPPGSPTPSERQLVEQFKVARMTVRQAMDALVAEGLVERLRGRGSFVADRSAWPRDLRSFTEEMRHRGLLPESQTLIARRETAGPGVAKALGVSEGDPVLHWKRLRRADGQPMCLEDAFLNEILLPGFLQAGVPTSLYEALEARGLRPTWAEDAVTAVGALPEESHLLEVPVGAPVLRVSRRALALDKPIEVSRSTYRADRFTLWRRYETTTD